MITRAQGLTVETNNCANRSTAPEQSEERINSKGEGERGSGLRPRRESIEAEAKGEEEEEEEEEEFAAIAAQAVRFYISYVHDPRCVRSCIS